MNPRAGKGLHPLMENLRTLRVERQISIQGAARKLKVAPATVWAWEAGRRQPNLWQTEEYARLVGATLQVSPLS